MLKKLLTYTLVVTTAVWSVGLLATPLAVGAAQAGDLVKKAGSPAVYYLGSDNKLHAFPRADIFNTWFSNFNSVITISDTEFASYGLPGSNVAPRPGVGLIQIVDSETPWNIFSPDVYALSGNGVARKIASASVAEAIFGANWESLIIPITATLFGGSYTSGADINSASDYNRNDEMAAATTVGEAMNLGTPGDPVSTGTSLTVSLAADTPASGLVIGNTINNKFTKVNLTASADGDIVVDQLQVERGGTVASDGPFSSIAILDAATGVRIGNTKNLNSQHMATFNDDIVVPAGTTKSIFLVGNMGATTAYAGEIPSLNLTSITLTGNASVVGSLPIVGNYQTINGTITVGALTVANGSNNPVAGTQKIGTTNHVFSGIQLSADSTEDFHVNHVTFDQGGTASDSDVINLDVVVDDTVRGTVSQADDGKVTFTFSPALLVEKGKTIQVDIRGDIESGSDRTVRFDVEDESDVRAVGQLYGAEVKVSAGSGATADANPFWTGPVTTVDKGSLRISPATFSSANIPEDDDQITLGKFEFEAKGESIQVTRLPIGFTVSSSTGLGVREITNVSLYDENGTIVAGPIDATRKYYGSNQAVHQATSTDTITIPVGTHVYTVMADLDADFETNDTIVAHIKPGQLTAEGDTTDLAVTPTPSTEQSSATMTVQSASISLSVGNTPIAQNVVAGTKQHEFANVILSTNSSGEDIRVTTLRVQVDCLATCSPSNFSNWSIYDGSTELATTNDPDSQTTTKTTAADDATSTFTFSTPLVIPRGTSKTLTVKADISNSTSNNGTVTVGVEDTTSSTITAKGASSSNDAALTISASAGQTQTIKTTGSLTISRDNSSPNAGLIPASSSGITVGIFNATAQNEAINLEKLYLTAVQANSGGWDQVSMVHIYDGGTLLASVTPTSSDATDRTVLIDTTNNPIVIPQDAAKKLTIKVDTAGSNYEVGSAGDSGQGFWLKIAAAGDVTAKGAASGNTISTKSVTNASTTAQYLFRSVPTVGPDLALPSSTLDSGTKSSKDLYSFSVSADSAGDIALHRVSFLVSTNVATVTDMILRDNVEQVAFQPTSAFTWVGTTDGGTDSWTGIGNFFFVDNQTAPATAATASNVVPYTISAGTTKTFTLTGTTICDQTGGSNCNGTSGSGSISIQLLGDTSLLGTVPAGATALADSAADLQDGQFIWSDLWRTSILGVSSTTASTTEQWTNGTHVALTNGGKMQATSTGSSISR